MSLTDTHCHLDFDRFDADRNEVIERAKRAGVSRILVPAVDLSSARRIDGLVRAHAFLFGALGFHPTEIADVRRLNVKKLRRHMGSGKIVAIGEIGLDYYWVSEPDRREVQRTALRAQLEFAAECRLPAILHLREQGDAIEGACSDDMLQILADWIGELRRTGSSLIDRPGVLHSFSGSLETARKAISLGFFIGVTGPVTFPNATARQEMVRQLPLERLLIETDSPFLAPQSHRGQRNEPAFVADIADKIAEIQSRTPEEICSITSSSASRLFAWGEPD